MKRLSMCLPRLWRSSSKEKVNEDPSRVFDEVFGHGFYEAMFESASASASATSLTVKSYETRVVPKQIISLIGRRGCGKTCLAYSFANNVWLDHPTRRELMRPGLRLVVIVLARQILAKALISGHLIVSEWPAPVQIALQEAVRPLHPSMISLNVFVLLHEFGVFQKLLYDTATFDFTTDEGFGNAKLMLVDEFPVSLFTQTDYVPTPREMALFRPPTVCLFELYRNETSDGLVHTKIVDLPGSNDIDPSGFHEYAFEFPERTMPVFVVGLHAIRRRIHIEAAAFRRVYEFALEKNITRVGLVLNQVDALTRQVNFGQELQDIVRELLQEAFRGLDRNGPAIVIGVTDGLDEASASTALHALSTEQTEFRGGENDSNFFHVFGIAPHRDVGLSREYSTRISWSRSVFLQASGTDVAKISIRQSYCLLNEEQRGLVKTLLKCAKRKDCMARNLPETCLLHIAAFLVSLN